MAHLALFLPLALFRGVEREGHETVLARGDTGHAVPVRPDHQRGGAQHAAGHLQRAHEDLHYRARPDTFISAPAIVHGLAQHHRHRAQWQLPTLHHMGRAYFRGLQELIGDAADGGGRHVRNRRCPLGGALGHMVLELIMGRVRLHIAMFPVLVIRTDLDGVLNDPCPFQCRIGACGIEWHGAMGAQIP